MRWPILIAIWLAYAVTAMGQSHPNGYAFGTMFGGTGENLWLVDNSGNVTASLVVGTSNVHGVVMDRNNDRLLVSNLDGKIYEVDPQVGAVVGTVVDLTGLSLRDIAVDQNGDYFTTDSNLNDALYRIDAGGLVSTIAIIGDNPYAGMEIDIDSSSILLQSRDTPDPLRLISRDGAVVTTIATSMNARYGICQHIPTGDIYGSTCCGDNSGGSILRLPFGSSVPTVFAAVSFPRGIFSMKPDRVSALNQELIVGALNSTIGGRGVFKVDLGTAGVSTLSTIVLRSVYETEILYRRNVHSNRVSRGQWLIGIKIPEDAGKGYLLAVTSSGVRPGVRLPSGRLLGINPDPLTFLGVQVGLAPFLTQTTGVLDVGGRGVSVLNVSSLGSAVNGVPLWFIAVTFDPMAPDGLKTITDPHIIKIEGV